MATTVLPSNNRVRHFLPVSSEIFRKSRPE
jgi:hypothetical protein